MQRLTAIFLVIVFASSCGESPPTQQVPSAESVGGVPTVGVPTAGVPTADVPTVDSPAVDGPSDDSLAVEAEAKPQSVDALSVVERATRLEVGDLAPNFRLQDQTGTERTLESLLAQGKVALVFHRSAEW